MMRCFVRLCEVVNGVIYFLRVDRFFVGLFLVSVEEVVLNMRRLVMR